MIKKIAFILASLFLSYYSVVFIQGLLDITKMSRLAILLNSWLVNMFVTGIFAFLSFAAPIEICLPKSYYKIHNPKHLKRLAKFLGIELFRKFLLVTLWRNQKGEAKYFNGKKSGIEKYVTKTCKSEIGHLIPFVLLFYISFIFYFKGIKTMSLAILLWNLIGNLYPVILQRVQRMRIQIILNRSSLL